MRNWYNIKIFSDQTVETNKRILSSLKRNCIKYVRWMPKIVTAAPKTPTSWAPNTYINNKTYNSNINSYEVISDYINVKSSKKSLYLLCGNAQSIVKHGKFDEPYTIQSFKKTIHIIVLSEVWTSWSQETVLNRIHSLLQI